MPIYEYQCEKCRHHLEALQKFSDKPLRECPECGKHSLKRLISAPMFRLAGSGWYETDFKSDSERKRNLAGKDEAPAAESTSSDKTAKTDAPEAKPEPKAAPKTEPVAAKKSARGNTPISKPASRAKPVVKKPAAKKKAARTR
jgi:putative FmdB family regulatory protein